MVAGAVILVGLAAVLFIFREQIGDFVGMTFTKPLTEAAGELQTTVQENFFDPIFAAGQQAGRLERERLEREQIATAEADILQAAKDQGFETIEAFNKATDSGSIVIGGERTIVDFGLIGDVLPTDPSPEFIAANPELFATRGETRFGGQR